MSGYFDDSDIDMDENELAEVDAFLEYIAAKREEYFSVPRLRVINPQRLKEFRYALFKITSIAKAMNPNAKIEYTLDDDWKIGISHIRIEISEMSITDVKEFIEAVKFATNFEIYPLLDGNIRIGMMFCNMWDNIETE